MNDETRAAVPTMFKVIAGIAVLWNAAGLYAYLADVMMSPEALAALPEAQQAMRLDVPAWATSGYAIAVHAGFIGSIGLLLKKAWCIPVLIVSLAGVLVQQTHIYFLSDAMEVLGAAMMVFPIVVLGVALFLVWYARSAKEKGWIS